MEDTRLKQRLVGAIVLVSLAVIFIPMILSGNKQAANSISGSNIPEKPQGEFVSRIIPLDKQAPEPAPLKAPVVSEPEPVKPADKVKIYKAPTVAKVEQQKTAPKVTKPAPKPAPEPAPKPAAKAPSKPTSGWVAQVGSFSSKSNAYGLRDTLRKKGLSSSFVDSIKTDGKTTYRVRLGPESSKDKAATLLAKASKITKTKGFVVRYP